MFLAGLKFALGLVLGLTLLSGFATLGLIGAELYDRWRQKYNFCLQKERVRALRHPMPPIRVSFRFLYRTDDWIAEHHKAKDLE